MALSRRALRSGAPWAALVVGLWLLQVWSIWGSPFSMEVTLLQGIFVLVFVVLILVLAEARVREGT